METRLHPAQMVSAMETTEGAVDAGALRVLLVAD
jgi:hypothetical protein